MGRKLLVFMVTGCFVIAAIADEIDLVKWEELSALALIRDDERKLAYVPKNFGGNIHSKEGVFHQVFNHQVNRAKAQGSPARILDTRWEATVVDPHSGADAPKTTFQIIPGNTTGFIDAPAARFHLSYQPFLRQSEFKIIPRNGPITFSHVQKSVGVENLLLFNYEW